jgi:hypothetical protein
MTERAGVTKAKAGLWAVRSGVHLRKVDLGEGSAAFVAVSPEGRMSLLLVDRDGDVSACDVGVSTGRRLGALLLSSATYARSLRRAAARARAGRPPLGLDDLEARYDGERPPA